MLSVPEELATARVPLKPPNPAPVQVPVERGAVSVVWGWGPSELLPMWPFAHSSENWCFLKVFKEKSYCMGTALQL